MKPRILIFSTAYFPYVGGAEVAVRQITDRLTNYEFEMITVNLDGHQLAEEKIGNILVRRIGSSKLSKYFFPLAAYSLACKLNEQVPYQAVWAIMANHAGMAAVLMKRRFNLPFLLTLQEGDDIGSRAYQLRLLGPKMFRVFQLADQVQAISEYLAQWGTKMGVQGDTIIVPNGVAVERYHDHSWQLSANPTVVTTSRLVYKNGIDNLIKALPFLSKAVNLQIAGAGPLLNNLKKLAADLEVSSRVQFLGHVDQEEIPQILEAADVFVRTSRSEGLGNSFLEAMAAGLPVVGTPVGGIPDFLKEGETGWLVPPDKPRLLADKINDILDAANQPVIERVVKQAKTVVTQKYSWEAVTSQMDQIFARLLDNDRRSH